MSYPFSNLSTVVLATDIPVLPVEELRAETTNVRERGVGVGGQQKHCLILLSGIFCFSTAHLLYSEA